MPDHWKRLMWIAVFAVAFGYVEAAVVVYLRNLYYPEGFSLPLKPIEPFILVAEIGREVATMVMLVAAALLAGRGRWTRFGLFLAAFGVWDIFYYVWLKVLLNWPVSLADWDVLFLIPIPWIAPVYAPLVLSLMMITAGVVLVHAEGRGERIRPPASAWAASALGAGILLYSFLADLEASLHFKSPAAYPVGLFGAGVLCLALAVALTFLPGRSGTFRRERD